MKLFITTLAMMILMLQATAQDPEFPKNEFIMHLRISNGMVTNFKSNAPDIYTGGLQLIPQYTFVGNRLRGGVVLGAFYTAKKLQALAGPTISLKLKTFNAGFFGGGGNLHLSLDHLWGTEKEKLIGGGLNLDLLNKIVLTASLHRDYGLNSWWLQTGVAFRLSKVKQPPHP